MTGSVRVRIDKVEALISLRLRFKHVCPSIVGMIARLVKQVQFLRE